MNASTLHKKIYSEGENRDWNFGEAQKKSTLSAPCAYASSDFRFKQT